MSQMLFLETAHLVHIVFLIQKCTCGKVTMSRMFSYVFTCHSTLNFQTFSLLCRVHLLFSSKDFLFHYFQKSFGFSSKNKSSFSSTLLKNLCSLSACFAISLFQIFFMFSVLLFSKTFCSLLGSHSLLSSKIFLFLFNSSQKPSVLYRFSLVISLFSYKNFLSSSTLRKNFHSLSDSLFIPLFSSKFSVLFYSSQNKTFCSLSGSLTLLLFSS